MPLVSATDGTQTFGWTDGVAGFSTKPPTLTVPPYTEIEFPLYLKPASTAYEDVIAAIQRSLRQPSTPLNAAFFARANVDALQTAIVQRVLEGMGMRIDRQSDWELLLVMRRVYMETSTNWPDDVGEEVARLNALVLQLSAEAVSRNITRYMTYRSSIPMPTALPSPAEMLTSPPFETGTPAPLLDFNTDLERTYAEFRRTLPPSLTGTPAPMTMAPLTPEPGLVGGLNDEYERQRNALWATTPPRETPAPS